MTGPTEKPAHDGNRGAGLAQRSSERKDSSSNRAEDQRQRLLQRLGEGAVSTIEARRDLDILAPAARVHELRHGYGYRIETVWIEQATDAGKRHRVALYVLRASEPYREAA